jgi:trigger factor
MVQKLADQKLLQEDFMERTINSAVSEELTELQVRVVGPPQITVSKFVPFSLLEITVESDIIPIFTLPSFEGSHKKLRAIEVSDEEIDKVIRDLRLQTAERIESPNTAQPGDEMTANIQAKDEKGQPISLLTAKTLPLILGENRFIQGMDEHLIGLKKGQKKQFTLSLPKERLAEHLAGKRVAFEIEVIDVQSLRLPDADDKWAVKLGAAGNLENLRNDIRRSIYQKKQAEQRDEVIRETIDGLVAKAKFDLPQSLLDQTIQDMLGDIQRNLEPRGVTFAQYLEELGLDEKSYVDQKIRPQAERQTRTGLMLGEIASREAIAVPPEMLGKRLEDLKQRFGSKAGEGYFDQPQVIRDVRSQLLGELTMQLVYDKTIGRTS